MRIRKDAITPLPEDAVASIVNSKNITNKAKNTYSAEIIDGLLSKNSINITLDSAIKQFLKNDEYEENGICHINGLANFNSTLTTGDWNVIGTIEEKYRPLKTIWFPATLLGSQYSTMASGIVRIATDGTVKVWCKTANMYMCTFSAEWRCAS